MCGAVSEGGKRERRGKREGEEKERGGERERCVELSVSPDRELGERGLPQRRAGPQFSYQTHMSIKACSDWYIVIKELRSTVIIRIIQIWLYTVRHLYITARRYVWLSTDHV